MEPWLGPLGAFGASVTWALGASVYARLTLKYPASVVNVSRAAVALVLFMAWVMVREGSVMGAWYALASAGQERVGWLALSILASFAFGDVIFFWSTRVLGVAGALAIASSYPVIAAIAGALFESQPLNAGQSLGLMAVVGGTILVILAAPSRARGVAAADGGAPKFVSRKSVGVALAFMTSLCWALNTWAVAQGGEGLHPAVGNVYRMGLALLLCPILGLFLRGSLKAQWLSTADFRRTLPIFLLEGFAGTIFFFYGLTHSSLAVGATLTSLAPVLAYGFGLIVRTERFEWRRATGILLVVSGLVALLGLG